MFTAASFRRLLRKHQMRIMTRADRDAVLATVPCPNRRCGAAIGEFCRDPGCLPPVSPLPHPARVRAWKRVQKPR
jgi:hypothetical protein